MPVLDAKALKIDPEGMAFLSSVLRQTAPRPAIAKKVRKLDEPEARAIRQRERLLHDTV